MSFYIHKKFASHRQAILNLSQGGAAHIAMVMQDNRNVVTKVELPEGTFVVKDFRGMYLLNRLAYSIFRKSKAIRSFEHSERLNAMGILTPDPVAWIDDYSMGLLRKSTFISTFFPYKTLQRFIADNQGGDPVVKEDLLRHLAAFAFKIHQRGVYHEDFSVGNIFVIPKDSGYDFALTDLNRMRFMRSISFNDALSNFRKIQLEPADLKAFITNYAWLSARSPEESLSIFYRLKDRSSKLRKARKKIRRYTLGIVESIQSPKKLPDLTIPATNKKTNFQVGKDHELQSPNKSTSQKTVSQPHPEYSQFPDRRESKGPGSEANSDHPAQSPTWESSSDYAPDTRSGSDIPKSKNRPVR